MKCKKYEGQGRRQSLQPGEVNTRSLFVLKPGTEPQKHRTSRKIILDVFLCVSASLRSVL